LGILNLWILWLAQEARKEMLVLEQRQTAADREFANFTPLAAGRLRQLKRIPVSGGGLTGEIREAVPIGA